MRELNRLLPLLIDEATERIILFGSTARGVCGSTSDLDLLIVKEDARNAVQRVGELYRRACPRVATDLLVYTPAELEAARATSSFLRSVLRDGEVVYERS